MKRVLGYPLPGKGPKNTGKRELGTMGTTVIFKPTAVQKKALSLLKGGAKHILLFGGSRSGKTTVLVMAIIYRALRFAGSLICFVPFSNVFNSG